MYHKDANISQNGVRCKNIYFFLNTTISLDNIAKKEIYILAIESSCDDTSAAVVHNGKVLSNVVSSQTEHINFGGVVPEVAGRQHILYILPVIDEAIRQAGISKEEINAVACTVGPGLLGSLMVGLSTAKSLAMSWGIPLIGVHHMHAHVMAHFADDPIPSFPFLCLIVSGGHTLIIKMDDFLTVQVLGTTIDDAAGEAFDKTGKMLGLSYPAGPIIDEMSKKGKPIYEFPKAKLANLDYSFSGLKTAIMYFLQQELSKNPNFISDNINDICASVQHVIVNTLMEKLIKAITSTGITHVGIAGGVSANSALRQALIDASIKYNFTPHIPRFAYCTDNAAMVGVTGYYKYLERRFDQLDLKPSARMDLLQL